MSRSVILAGAAAGVAAAFNTPLAGIVFAIEEMARAFEHRYSGVVLTAIVLAGASSLSILGNYGYFGFADGDYSLGRDWLAIAVLGIARRNLGRPVRFAVEQGQFAVKRPVQKSAFFDARDFCRFMRTYRRDFGDHDPRRDLWQRL